MLTEMANYYKIVFQWSHAFQLLFVAGAIVCVLTPLRAERRSILIGIAEFIGVFVACMLSEMFFFGLTAYSRALGGMCFPLALFVVVVLYSIFFCRFYARLRVMMTCMFYASVVTVTVYISQLTQLLTFPSMFLQELTAVAVNLLVVLIAVIFTRFSVSKFIIIPGVGVGLVFVNSVAVVVSVFVYYILSTSVFNEYPLRQIGIVYTFIAGIVMYVMMVVTYLLIYIICQRHGQVLELQAEEKMAEADKKMLDITQKSLADLRLIRHDIRNRYSYISLLLDNGQYAELKEYLQDMKEEIAPTLSVIDCGNKTLTNILNMEKAKAESRGVRMETDLNVPPILPFRDTALCSVFSNLIDNAIEASMLCAEDGAEIRVRVSILQEYLYIGVMNRLPAGRSEEEALALKTTKQNASNHGFGTKIVRKIAEQYNGYVTYSVENGRFIAEVMLDMMFAVTKEKGGNDHVSLRGV